MYSKVLYSPVSECIYLFEFQYYLSEETKYEVRYWEKYTGSNQ